jgi:hypothetical protein
MVPLVLAAFESQPAAEAAAERIRQISSTLVVSLYETTPDSTNAGAIEADEMVTGGLLSDAANLLNGIFGSHVDKEQATDLGDVVGRKATVVSVHVDSPEAARRVASLLTESGGQRVTTLPQPGLES